MLHEKQLTRHKEFCAHDTTASHTENIQEQDEITSEVQPEQLLHQWQRLNAPLHHRARAWLQSGERDGKATRGVCAKQVRMHDGGNHRQRGLARWRQGGLQAHHQRRRELL